MATNTQYVINGVEALWPRINKTYRFDAGENRSIPCDPLDDGAKYETKFRMDKDTAKNLFIAMTEAYQSLYNTTQNLLNSLKTSCLPRAVL